MAVSFSQGNGVTLCPASKDEGVICCAVNRDVLRYPVLSSGVTHKLIHIAVHLRRTGGEGIAVGVRQEDPAGIGSPGDTAVLEVTIVYQVIAAGSGSLLQLGAIHIGGTCCGSKDIGADILDLVCIVGEGDFRPVPGVVTNYLGTGDGVVCRTVVVVQGNCDIGRTGFDVSREGKRFTYTQCYGVAACATEAVGTGCGGELHALGTHVGCVSGGADSNILGVTGPGVV